MKCRCTLGVVAILLYGAVTVALATPPNRKVSTHLPGLQNEEQVWICPSDTSIVFANHRDFRLGYRQLGMARSTDGGVNWTDTLMSPEFQFFDWQSDPALTVTSSGRLIHCYLDFMPDFGVAEDSSLIRFLTSDDCGASWSGPYNLTPTHGNWFEDKQFLTSDRTGGLNDGNVYISWTRFSGTEPARVMFCRSLTGGTTWGDTLIVGSPFTASCFEFAIGGGQFSQPLVGQDGSVYVFWEGLDIDSSAGCDASEALVFNKSLDGGQTWTGKRFISRVAGSFGGTPSLTTSGIDIYSQPVTEADSSSGIHKGNLYLQYRDTAAATPTFDRGDILFRRSLDTGSTWSSPFVVNDDKPSARAEQFHNWMVANDRGILSSIWYDTRLDSTRYLFDVFAAYSFDGGATWTSNERVSSVSSNPGLLLAAIAKAQADSPIKGRRNAMSPNSPLAGLIAEYIGLSVHGDKNIAVWTDTRDGDQDVYSATWDLHLTVPRLLTPGIALACDDTLRWATAWKEDIDQYRVEIDVDGTFLTPEFVGIVNENFVALPPGLSPSLYNWRVKAYNAPGGIPIDESDWSPIEKFGILTACGPCECECHADPVCDAVLSDVQDVVTTINIAFRNNSNLVDGDCPPHGSNVQGRTDVDCSGSCDVIDVIKVINVAFRNFSPLTEYCQPCGQ